MVRVKERDLEAFGEGRVNGTARDAERRLAELRRVDLFEECTAQELRAIEELGSEVVIPAGGHLIGHGHAALECLIVLDGTAVVSRNGEVIGIGGPGSIFGEMALLRDGHPNATVVAVTPVRAMVLNHTEFYELLRIPSARAKILRTADVRTIEAPADENARTPYLASVGW